MKLNDILLLAGAALALQACVQHPVNEQEFAQIDDPIEFRGYTMWPDDQIRIEAHSPSEGWVKVGEAVSEGSPPFYFWSVKVPLRLNLWEPDDWVYTGDGNAQPVGPWRARVRAVHEAGWPLFVLGPHTWQCMMKVENESLTGWAAWAVAYSECHPENLTEITLVIP